MGWIKATILWGLVYTAALWCVFGILSAMDIRLDKRYTSSAEGPLLPMAFFGGLAVIGWYGFHGRLPGVGLSAWPAFSFIVSLVVWSASLGLLAGGAVAVTTYRTVSQTWARGEGASALIIFLPSGFACCAGALLGGIVATVLALV
jgi:hypothetical protein